MKKILVVLLVLAVVCACFGIFAACDTPSADTFEIAIVTDVGSLMDGGFNQGTYEGAKAYAEANGLTYKYYQPANGSQATDNDRIAAMRQAVKNGAKVIVTPGYLQAKALETVAKESPEVKFIFVDGWALGLNNVTAVVYKEAESGYMAGYAAVKEGYTKLGGVFGGGGSTPACNRFAYGYVLGAKAAAGEKAISLRLSYKEGGSFSASDALQAYVGKWYSEGTEVVFSCGGSMVDSVKAACELTPNGKIIGVDVDQSALSERVITSAVKGLATSVTQILTKMYEGKWDAELADKASNLGAANDATGLPTATWRMTKFTLEDYNKLFNDIKNGTIVVDASKVDATADCNNGDFWKELESETVSITFEK